jgi:hypothetical protein
MKDLAPVVVFAYRRPDHLRRTLASLMRCDGFSKSPVIVYFDGPSDTVEIETVATVRELAVGMLGAAAEYHYSEVNIGLARSVIAGVKDVVDRFGRAIVVEDDLELSENFLSFMNSALDRYASEERVFQISGYIFDIPKANGVQSAQFLPFTASWGWATWKRAWDQFDPLASGWETMLTDRPLRHRFNLDGAYDYATMLSRQMKGQVDSWAVRWYWTVFKANGLVLFPPATLVHNKGGDGSGTHGKGVLRTFSVVTTNLQGSDIAMPSSVDLCQEAFTSVKKVIWRQNGRWLGALVDRLRWFMAVHLDR